MTTRPPTSAAFSTDEAQRYTHGPDYHFFGNPWIEKFVSGLSDQTVFDFGGGKAPWAIAAARAGARIVYSVDDSEAMHRDAQSAIALAGVGDRVIPIHADVRQLPFPGVLGNTQADAGLMCNFICCVPGPDLDTVFRNAAAAIRKGGRLLLFNPNNLGILFTDGSESESALRHDLALDMSAITGSLDEELGPLLVLQFSQILRGTFLSDGMTAHLVQDEAELAAHEGKEVWRKLPSVVVKNFRNSWPAIIRAFEAAGFESVGSHEPKFETEIARLAHNRQFPKNQLGPEYLHYAPFRLEELVRR